MTQVTIREIQGQEMLQVMHWLPGYALQSSPPMPDKAKREEQLTQRGAAYMALFEDENAVACMANTAMTQNVRGKLFAAGGIWDVATHPAARRKGYARQLLTRLLATVREKGQPFSCLYPFRESFYERMGYVSWPQPRQVQCDPAALHPLLTKDLGGEVELVQFEQGYDTYRRYLRQLQPGIHGMALFDGQDQAPHNNFWLALARVDGELTGVMAYNLRGKRPTEYTLRAIRFYYHTSRGKYLLLSWIARHIDQAREVEIWLPPCERPETWWADINIVPQSIFRAPMSRIVDLAQLGGMEVGAGRFAAAVRDPLCPWNEGTWQFEAVDGRLQVSTARQADCELHIQGLTALVYGTHDPTDFEIRGWGNPPPNLQQVMRTMFPPKQPYLHEYF